MRVTKYLNIKHLFSNKRNFVYILIVNFIVQLVVHLYILIYMGNPIGNINTNPDGDLYADIAYSIRHLTDTIQGVYHPHFKGEDIGYQIMPGYPLLISPLFENWELISIFQTLLFSIGLICLMVILENKFLKFFAIIAPLWIIISTSWSYHNQALIESPTISLLLIIIYFLDKYFKEFNLKDFVWLSILFGILIAVNNRYIFHYCGFIPFLLILKIFEKRIKIKHLIYSILIVTALMAPWHIRQYIVYGKFVLFSPVRSDTFEKSQEKDKEMEKIIKISKYKEYLLDSLNHALKDSPKELEEARRLYFEKKEKYEKGYIALKEAAELTNKKNPIIVLKLSKKMIQDTLDFAANNYKKPVFNYNDGKMDIVIEDMKVKELKVLEFENLLEYRKFEEMRIRKMVPTYDQIVNALLKSHSNFGDTPEKLQKFLSDFSYSKYKQLVYDKFEPSNKFELFWNRFIDHFNFYRTDFQLDPQWDPRIQWPSHYNNPIEMLLDAIMLPLLFINIIPLIIAIYKRDWFVVSLFVFVLLHIILHSLISGIGDRGRYRLTIYPMWITFAVYGYDQIARWIIKLIKEKKLTRAFIASKLSLIKK